MKDEIKHHKIKKSLKGLLQKFEFGQKWHGWKEKK